MWGTDGSKVITIDDGWVWMFSAVEHWNAECVGYLCGRLVRHARRIVLKVVSNGGFGEALVGVQWRLA